MIRDTALNTLSAAIGDLSGLFAQSGPVFHGRLEIDADADLPGGTRLLQQGHTADVLVRVAPVGDALVPRTICLKVPDAYGPGSDQDLLLASSADGAPLHHAVLPAASCSERLYSSLWLYLAGLQLTAFGVRVDAAANGPGPRPGDRLDFLLSGALSRFRSIGVISLADTAPGARVTFAGSNAGGGLRALPPALFYRG
ncbi:hypothetical protein EAH80_09040 [Mycobacterium hodleri]|uniref:Uncharacterized protein n=1 Tax=Mycolicibacterium hodleri TaxID=49897 RepID=A0A502ED69_9MYCO|nr:hypothetical protein EAH80_09040 [Mycolicibacterium hodleri]